MECTSCKKENRAIARFCKHCGKDLPVQQVSPLSTETIDPDFDSLCGLDDIKARVRRELTVSRNMQRAGKKYDLRQLHAIIIGETGSGKSKLVNELAKIYC